MGVQCASQRRGDLVEGKLAGDHIQKNLKVLGLKGREKTRKEQWIATVKLKKLKEKLKDIEGEMRRDIIMRSIF